MNIHDANDSSFFISAVAKMLPPVFARHKLTELTGGLVNSRTISNLQSKKEGPPAVKYKGRIGLEKETFIAWLSTRITPCSN